MWLAVFCIVHQSACFGKIFSQLKRRVPWQNLTAFLSIRSGNKQWNAIHRDVASISKMRVLLPAYK